MDRDLFGCNSNIDAFFLCFDPRSAGRVPRHTTPERVCAGHARALFGYVKLSVFSDLSKENVL